MVETRQNLNRDFNSASQYDTTILLSVTFWVENFMFQTLKRNSFHKGNLMEEEHISYQNFRDKIRFWKKLSQRFRMRIKNFKTFQVLKLKTSNEWKFEGKKYSWNQCLREILLLKNNYYIILHCKKVKFCIFVPCWKTRKEKKRSRKTNSIKNFESYSDFETTFLQELQFWKEQLKTCAS